MSPRRAPRRPRVGVLAVQGAFAEHAQALSRAGAGVLEVRRADALGDVDGLVIPGGESTTLGLVGGESGLLAAVRSAIDAGLPVFGTCAGLIMLADEVHGGAPPLIGGLGVRVRRNAYGRQRASFEAPVSMPSIGPDPFPGIFIRAPWVEAAGPGVEVLGELGGRIVAARQGAILATAFHPELTADLRIHRVFIDGLRSAGRSREADAEGRTYVRSQ